MTESQFSIRSLLIVTFAAACGLALARQAVEQIPSLLFFVFVVCVLLFSVGLAVIVVAACAAFRVAVFERDDNRSNHLRRCRRLILLGAAAATPLAILVCWSLFVYI